MKNVFASLVDASKLGGYVRAGVAASLPWLIGHVPILKDLLPDPATQTALGVVLAGVVVGLWSHFVKS